ncbi:hypothetical protein ACWZJV_05400 [Nocardioides sp. WG-D5]
MGLFSRKGKTPVPSDLFPNWSTDPIVQQFPSRATTPPDDLFEAVSTILERGGGGNSLLAWERTLLILSVQIDRYAEKLPDGDQMVIAKGQILARPDFDIRMLFDFLTYFGGFGIAANNALVEQVPSVLDAIAEAVAAGAFSD